ncbi:MAG: hypothetical protein IJ400_00805 [Clostridia bacterium]|nr:hypothetical protein [Clostridia bacterium]
MTKIRKLAIALIIALALSFNLTSCSLVDTLSADYSSFDINTLANEIILESDPYGKNSYYKSHCKGRAGGEFDDVYYENWNFNTITIENAKVTGVALLSASKTIDNLISYDISLTLKTGTADLVVICDDRIIDRIKCNTGNNSFTLSYNEGKVYYIKAVASKAEFAFSLNRQITDF